jgi:hypothetical protein
MDKRCTICTHPNHTEIDNALLSGTSLRSVANHYELSLSSLSRHTKHLRRALAVAADADQQNLQAALLDKLDLFEFRLERIFHKAQDHQSSLHISLGCVQEAVRIFTLREKIRQSQPGNF